jgi:hypothetical protein
MIDFTFGFVWRFSQEIYPDIEEPEAGYQEVFLVLFIAYSVLGRGRIP